MSRPLSRMLTAPLLLGALLSTGCSISSLVNQIERENEDTVDLICACDPPTLPGLSCEDTYGATLWDFDDECVVDALEQDKSTARDTLNCTLDVQKSYNECLENELVCDDILSFDNCQNRLEDFDDCPELPQSIQDEIAKCG